jgi:hypothetical protein
MNVSGVLHTPAVLTPGKQPLFASCTRLCEPQGKSVCLGEEKDLATEAMRLIYCGKKAKEQIFPSNSGIWIYNSIKVYETCAPVVLRAHFPLAT